MDRLPEKRWLSISNIRGDSFTQFRFSEEKDWEMDSFAASQMSAVFVDLPALAQTLQQVPLHQRLNLEAELVQVSTPVELPTMTLAAKQELPKTTTFAPPTATLKVLSTNQKVSVAASSPSAPKPQVSPSAAEMPVDDADEELDQLLSLQKPASGVSGKQSVGAADEEHALPEKAVRGSDGGDRREGGGGERQRRRTSQVRFHEEGSDRGRPGGLARQYDLLTAVHRGKT
ncbi:Cell death regulator Aven [Nibea albiflora]|uniref:Cell death regulator Aven n=1 Tax=Nibea albiflora TaxID=240163 RepID=A0ACB7FB35_NIBAL|nr:Cell death regulator Aven [Nibea albiflora]